MKNDYGRTLRRRQLFLYTFHHAGNLPCLNTSPDVLVTAPAAMGRL